MTTKHSDAPDGIEEKSPLWHRNKFSDFTAKKQGVSEPSPHLAMVGHLAKGCTQLEKAWRIGCYAIPYSLPVGQMMWSEFPVDKALRSPKKVTDWVERNWQGILKGTRRERRCVRSVKKYNECVSSYIAFLQEGFPFLQQVRPDDYEPRDYYEIVWNQVQTVKFFGRYIGIRVVEGLRRFCDMPAELPDIRSMGAWSPRKCLVYMYPDKQEVLLTENAKSNRETEDIAFKLSQEVRRKVPSASQYVIAAMLCEYRDAFEDRRQYVGWTIDQEPELFRKSAQYFGNSLDGNLFWKTRKAIFPHETLGELNGWEGTRWELTNILRDYGYVWNDIEYDYMGTIALGGDFSDPIVRNNG